MTAADLSFLHINRYDEGAPSDGLPKKSDDGQSLFSLSEMERRHILNVLRLVKGHKGKAARILEINPKTLYLKMKSYNIISSYE